MRAGYFLAVGVVVVVVVVVVMKAGLKDVLMFRFSGGSISDGACLIL